MSQNEKFNSLRALKSQAGFNLAELMIAAAIGTVVALGTSTLFIFAIEQFGILVEQNQAEEDLLWAAYHTRNYLSQAVALRSSTAGDVDTDGAGGLDETTWQGGGSLNDQGVIARNYDSRNAFQADVGGANASRMDLVALFPRENGYPTAAGIVGSELYTSAIYYLRPHIGLPGRLYFDVGESTSGAVQNLIPDNESIQYNNIVEYRITVDDTGGTPKAADIVIKARYFRTKDQSRRIFCPESMMDGAAPDVAACSNYNSPWRDIQMNLTVGFRNNILVDCANLQTGCTGATGSYNERLHGGIYFYKMAVPPFLTQ